MKPSVYDGTPYPEQTSVAQTPQSTPSLPHPFVARSLHSSQFQQARRHDNGPHMDHNSKSRNTILTLVNLTNLTAGYDDSMGTHHRGLLQPSVAQTCKFDATKFTSVLAYL